MKAPRILVVRTDRIGDVVLSTPVLTALRQRYPAAFIAMLVRPYTQDVVSGHPHLDEVILDEPEGEHAGAAGFWRLVRELRRRRFDGILLLHPTLRLAGLAWLAGIPLRIGTGYRAYSPLFNHRIYQHRKKSGRHELDLNLDLAAAIDAPSGEVQFHLHVPGEAEARVRRLLLERGAAATRPLVILHPGSGGSALDWPLTGFARLASRLLDAGEVSVAVTGSRAEKSLVDALCSQAPSSLIRLDGELTIKELLALYRQAAVTVANSTGPLHLAVAAGCRVVGLYCPLGACAPERWGPYGQLDAVLQPPLPPCEKCSPARCQHPGCMELITVDQVFAKVKEQLRKGGGGKW